MRIVVSLLRALSRERDNPSPGMCKGRDLHLEGGQTPIAIATQRGGGGGGGEAAQRSIRAE